MSEETKTCRTCGTDCGGAAYAVPPGSSDDLRMWRDHVPPFDTPDDCKRNLSVVEPPDQVVKNDTHCACGWLLPKEVMAFYEDETPIDNDPIPGAYTVLLCPTCGKGHSFFIALVDGDAPTAKA